VAIGPDPDVYQNSYSLSTSTAHAHLSEYPVEQHTLPPTGHYEFTKAPALSA